MEEYKISKEYDGRSRKLFKLNCNQCDKEIWKPKHTITDTNFCSKECMNFYRDLNGKKVIKNCKYCGKEFRRFQHLLDKVSSERYYCSKECQDLDATKQKGNCLNCGQNLIGKKKKFCSHECQHEFQYKENIRKWKNGELSGINVAEGISSWLRRFILDKYQNKCSICGWQEINQTTGKVPVQIDHIDGNYKNNTEENLRLLCPNCHSLTSTFGSLNTGQGREKRRLRLQITKNSDI